MKKIAKDVFQISVMPRNSINCYLIEDVLIDAGIRSSANKILKEIKGFDVNSHAITHAHADHQGSSKEVCEQLNIPFLCGEKDKTRAESGLVTEEYPNQGSLITKN
jgi:glyoxylase-like metal-dependent hydrolase (beta-lactamase superfamily II)